MNSFLNSNTKTIDLHGESKDIAINLVKEFIFDNYRLNVKQIIIIHGIGEGILKKAVHQELKKNKYVKDYHLDFFNVGLTIVELKNCDFQGKMLHYIIAISKGKCYILKMIYKITS